MERAELIAELFKHDTEVEVPSEGPAVTVKKDAHLRLRRTLTPASAQRGMKDEEAGFLITGSTGRRTSLKFSWNGNDFQMDGYIWGATEAATTHRIVACHGVTPGISRTRFHQLGERLTACCAGVRFCALVRTCGMSCDMRHRPLPASGPVSAKKLSQGQREARQDGGVHAAL
eukprot:COSAG01_NODE_17662_length_1133_cov_1.137331_2_plen_173_part_00